MDFVTTAHPVSALNEMLQGLHIDSVAYSFAVQGLSHSCTCTVGCGSECFVATAVGTTKKAAKTEAAKQVRIEMRDRDSGSDASTGHSSTRQCSLSHSVSTMESASSSATSSASASSSIDNTPRKPPTQAPTYIAMESHEALYDLRHASRQSMSAILVVAICIKESPGSETKSLGVAWTQEFSGYAAVRYFGLDKKGQHCVGLPPPHSADEGHHVPTIGSMTSDGFDKKIKEVFFVVRDKERTMEVLKDDKGEIKMLKLLPVIDLTAFGNVRQSIDYSANAEAGDVAAQMLRDCAKLM